MMKKIGFLGLGTMGLPMALNIAGAGFDVMVYNRTGGKAGPVLDAGAAEAESPTEVFDWADAVLMMLSGPTAINDVLDPVIMDHDFAPQASLVTVREMLKHIADTAYEINARIPNTLSNMNLITSAINRGLAREDACAIVKVFNE